MTEIGSSLWPRIAGLALVVESHALEPLEADPSLGFERVTTHVRLSGAGAKGLARTYPRCPESTRLCTRSSRRSR